MWGHVRRPGSLLSGACDVPSRREHPGGQALATRRSGTSAKEQDQAHDSNDTDAHAAGEDDRQHRVPASRSVVAIGVPHGSPSCWDRTRRGLWRLVAPGRGTSSPGPEFYSDAAPSQGTSNQSWRRPSSRTSKPHSRATALMIGRPRPPSPQGSST
jgi:hypothetical protein